MDGAAEKFPGPQAVAAATEEAANASQGEPRALRTGALRPSSRRRRRRRGADDERGEEKLRVIVEQIEMQTDVWTRSMPSWRARRARTKCWRMATVVGPACAAAIGSLVGSPLDFPNARALEKAMGLNLKEKSSGDSKGN